MLVKAIPDEKLCELVYFTNFQCYIVLPVLLNKNPTLV